MNVIGRSLRIGKIKIDISDLYDSEVVEAGKVINRLMSEFAKKANTKANLSELEKRAHDEFLKIGLVVEVNTVPCILADQFGRTGPPEIVVVGRIPGSRLSNPEDGFDLMDHERKRAEVLKSKETGEKFLGQKGERGV